MTIHADTDTLRALVDELSWRGYLHARRHDPHRRSHLLATPKPHGCEKVGAAGMCITRLSQDLINLQQDGLVDRRADPIRYKYG